MWIESRNLPERDIETDVCIVGTGPAGLTVARHLRGPRDIWVLEGGTTEQTEASREPYRGTNIGLPYFDLDTCRTRQFGGSSHCWGGYCRVYEELDFESRPRIPHSGWPFGFADILPFYERAHAVSGLGPVNYDYEFWARSTGQPPSPFTGPYVKPEIRQKSQYDLEGMRRELVASSNVHVCIDATVTAVNADENGRSVTSLTFMGSDKRSRKIRARQFVLAGGGIENPRLLLASNQLQQQGLGNDRDLVGRFFMEHVDYDTGRFRPSDPDLFRHQLAWRSVGGTPIRNSLAIAEPIRRREQLLRCFFHVGEQSVERTFGYRSAVHIASQVRRGRGVPNLRFHLSNLAWDRQAVTAAALWRLKIRQGDPGATGIPGVLRLRVTAEPSPNPASCVTLSTDRDQYGVPKVRLDWRISSEDAEHVGRSLELFAHDVHALGLGRVERRPPSEWPIRGTFHHMGTTRMSTDPGTGVVDGNCRVHGLSNLYVAGSSVFPTAGSGTPTLMIIVLALRLAEHLSR